MKRYLLVGLLMWPGAANAGPCDRTVYPSGPGLDLDVVRCQIAHDAKTIGDLQIQVNELAARLDLIHIDVAALTRADEAQKATLIEWLKAAQEVEQKK